MKNDNYHKVILTIIAACLTFNVFKDLDIIPHAHANSTVNNSIEQHLKTIMVPLNEDGSINVRLKDTPTLDINITDISTLDDIDANIEEVGGYSTYGTIDVNIKD